MESIKKYSQTSGKMFFACHSENPVFVQAHFSAIFVLDSPPHVPYSSLRCAPIRMTMMLHCSFKHCWGGQESQFTKRTTEDSELLEEFVL